MNYKVIILIIIFALLSKKIIFAQRFQSDNFVIEWGNFNMTGGTKASATYHLSDTVGQIAPGEYNSGAYTVESGFQYIYNTFNKFRFTINDSDLAIDFGYLSPGIATTASHTITIYCPAGHGYEILAKENHPLQILSSGHTIPDTTCNIGSTCTPSSANTWTESSSFGFGYNTLGINNSGTVTGVGTSQFFSSDTKYRPFSVNANTIMSENHPVQNHSAKVTYKALIDTNQAAGNYETSINFIAVPNY
jgi:hypothetical protein